MNLLTATHAALLRHVLGRDISERRGEGPGEYWADTIKAERAYTAGWRGLPDPTNAPSKFHRMGREDREAAKRRGRR